MASVGLLYVGAVLFVNALMMLGRVEARSAAIMNLFVGGMQVVLPTLLLVAAGDDTTAVTAAAGIYLFGFTYLYVGIGCWPASTPPASDGSPCSSRWRRSSSRG